MTEENTEIETNESTDTSVEAEQTEADAPKVNTFKVKIDGKEKEVTEEELIKDYQIRESSYERIKKAEALKEEVKPFLSVVRALKKGDLSVLKELGLKREDILNFSEKELQEYIEEQQMSPDARDAKKAKEEAAELKREKEIMLAEKAAQDIESQIISAFKEMNIPMKGNAHLIRRVAEYMNGDLEAGKSADALRSLKRAVDTRRKEVLEYLSIDGSEEFLDSLPSKFVDDVRKRGLKQVRSQSPLSNKTGATEQKPKQKSPISDEFRDYMKQEMRKRG